MYLVSPISAFDDNYIWCLSKQQDCVLVDPGDAQAVLAYLEKQQLKLTAILITHWHPDHTGGIQALVDACGPVPVYGPQSEHIPQVTDIVKQDDHIKVLGLDFEVIASPGHTLDHLLYFQAQEQYLFSGDTLFMAGCGRLFEGTAKQMLLAMDKISALPKATQIFAAHEYSLANLAFALHLEPDNQVLKDKITQVEELRAQNQPSLPTTLEQELQYNPFLRCRQASLIVGAKTYQHDLDSSNTEQVFAAVRACKDQF